MRRLYVIQPFKFKLYRNALERFYMSFVLPILEYGDVMWAGSSDCDLEKLDKVHIRNENNYRRYRAFKYKLNIYFIIFSNVQIIAIRLVLLNVVSQITEPMLSYLLQGNYELSVNDNVKLFNYVQTFMQ